MKTILLPVALFIISLHSNYAQETSATAFGTENLNWYNADPKEDQILGASISKSYKKLLQNKQPKKTVVVAVIDSGTDITHEDLQGMIWSNKDEIPNNNIDDDKNGYIDDVHGWNFIGNAKGENIDYENFEYTRIYKAGPKAKDYKAARKMYEEEFEKRTKEKENLDRFAEKYNYAKLIIKSKTGVEVRGVEDLNGIASTDEATSQAVSFLLRVYSQKFTEKSLSDIRKRNSEHFDSYLNLSFNPRDIAGDNPEDINDKNYGSPDVTGPRANHGTGVAGIIAGVRDNNIGIDGIASNVKLMILRSTPNGDERDKDVALAIKYAVENGADIINMSFGKAFSPQKNFVDDAIKLAEKSNVLVIHAAGNEGDNIDKRPRYPSDIYNNNYEASNFINVGASGKKEDETVACFFSNYGAKHVDIFAPGQDIVATDVNNSYSMSSGTSDAAPVVAGVAALVLSYYPELTPPQLISILIDSSTRLKDENVLKPGLDNDGKEKVSFAELCKSGGIVNAYEAIKLAESRKP